jgi:hypothetical protein
MNYIFVNRNSIVEAEKTGLPATKCITIQTKWLTAFANRRVKINTTPPVYIVYEKTGLFGSGTKCWIETEAGVLIVE